MNVTNFYNALMGVAQARTGGTISNVNLGRWLKRIQGKIVNDHSLLQDGNAGGQALWKLIQR